MAQELEKNAFAVLGASTTDGVRRLAQLADDAALFGEINAEAAFSVLTNSMRRLDAETRWLPGVSAETARAIIQYRNKAEPTPYPDLSQMTALARLNACRALLDTWKMNDVKSALALCCSLSTAWDGVHAKEVLEEINEDRQKASLPLIADIQDVYDRLDGLLGEMVSELFVRMNESGISMHEAMNEAAVCYGQTRSRFLEALVHAYALTVDGEISRLEEQLKSICTRAIKRTDIVGSIKIKDELERALTDWAKLSQPMRRLAYAKGRTDAQVRELYVELYRAAAHMYNVCRMGRQCVQLFHQYDRVFFDLPDVKEHLRKNLRIAEK